MENTDLVGIYGSLGAIFGTISDDSGNDIQPLFRSTFQGCSNLVSAIPASLFSGVSGQPIESMFFTTFSNSGVTGSIPPSLFSNLNGTPTADLFHSTFYKCSGLTGSLPAQLFSGIRGAPASKMFQSAFAYCSGLTGAIPAGLFSKIKGPPAPYMFGSTFFECTGLTSISMGLFDGIQGAPAESMFRSTFNGCTGITGTLPPYLFIGIEGAPAENMFAYTFKNCTGLTGSLSSDLFGKTAGSMVAGGFYATFQNCSSLTGYVPYTMLSEITEVSSGSSVEGFGYMFDGATSMDTTCPGDTTAMDKPGTGTSVTWGDAAFCNFSCPDGYLDEGNSISNETCFIVCDGGTYLASAYDSACTNVGSDYWAPETKLYYGETGVRYACPAGLTTTGLPDEGANEAEDCGKVLHIGNNIVRLRSEKRTSPSLAIAINDSITLYGDMILGRAHGNLRIKYKNKTYSVYNADLD